MRAEDAGRGKETGMTWLLRNIALAVAMTVIRYVLRRALDRRAERTGPRRV